MLSTLFFSLYALLMLPPLVYLFVLSVAGMRKPKALPAIPAEGKMAVLVPAHNEKLTIKRTVESLLAATVDDSAVDIYVIADNCTDNTAEIASALPVTVFEREHQRLRGKGAALQWAMAKLKDKNYTYMTVIDADSMVNKAFFFQLRCAFGVGEHRVVQTRNEALGNAYSGIKRLAMLGFNVLRARGRVRLGGSAGILGNGFSLHTDILEKVPFCANSIVEDLEYHTRLVEADICVAYCDHAQVSSEMPTDNAAADVQSSRWEGGRLGVLKAAWWPLTKKSLQGMRQGKFHALDALLDLMLLPIGYVVLLLFAGLVAGAPLIAAFGFLVVGVYVLGAAWCGDGWRELRVLLQLPHFLYRKIVRLPALLATSSTRSRWNRTPRQKK